MIEVSSISSALSISLLRADFAMLLIVGLPTPRIFTDSPFSLIFPSYLRLQSSTKTQSLSRWRSIPSSHTVGIKFAYEMIISPYFILLAI